MLASYYKLAVLPDKVRANHNIRSKARLDCIAYTNKVVGGYKGLDMFTNPKSLLYFYRTPPKNVFNADSKRLTEWALTNNSLNLSSIFIEDLDFPEIGYGYPNAKRLLSNSDPNPLFPFRNDGYLFLINKDYTEIELFIIPNGRNLISSYYQKMIDGGFDDEIRQLRNEAKPYFNYIGLVL
jgi:hypothetical protein